MMIDIYFAIFEHVATAFVKVQPDTNKVLGWPIGLSEFGTAYLSVQGEPNNKGGLSGLLVMSSGWGIETYFGPILDSFL